MTNDIIEKLPDFAKRMIDEENELCEKISKLDTFLLSDDGHTIDYAYYHLMASQLEVMQAYRRILHIRLHLAIAKLKESDKS